MVDDLNVTINLDHTDPSDLQIWLESPDGTIVRLVERAHADLDEEGDVATGGNGRNFRNTVFDDDADDSILDDDSLPAVHRHIPAATGTLDVHQRQGERNLEVVGVG